MTAAAPDMLDAAAAPDGRTATRLWGVLLLILVTLIWGTTFVATRALVARPVDPLPASVLTLSRFAIAFVLFAPFLRRDPRLWAVGMELGFWLWCGYASQAVGLKYIGSSRSAFITTLHVVFVPTLTALAGRRVAPVVWIAVATALAGTALLSYDGAPPGRGDGWTLVTAATYAVYIVQLDRYADRFPSRALTAVQLLAVALLSAAWVGAELPWTELPRLSGPVAANVVYLGVVATALTTWLQAVGQRSVTGPQASLLYTLEPVWATALAWAAFGETFGPRGRAGAGMILAAAVLSQWNPRMKAEG